MTDPVLGPLEYDVAAGCWTGDLHLPAFAALGSALEAAPVPGYFRARAGRFPLRVPDRRHAGVSAEQRRAVEHLRANEPAVLAAVLDRLAGAAAEEAEEVTGMFAALGQPVAAGPFDPRTDAVCTAVEVSSRAADGVAYLGFQFNLAGDLLEHGLFVVYHPTHESFGTDAEGLDQIPGP